VELPTSTPSVHVSRTINFGPDGRLHVAIGSSCNVCVEADPRRTTIQVVTKDGTLLTAADARPPALELPAHISPIDMRFYTGTAFPIAYRNALFIAFHGSARKTNGCSVARVVMTNGQPTGIEDFATGFLKDSLVLGRPAGLATGRDGALYVSDDSKGIIYRIAYRSDSRPPLEWRARCYLPRLGGELPWSVRRQPGRRSRPHDMECAVRHVPVQSDRPEVLESIGVVEIDRIARLMEIDDLAVGDRPDCHARTLRELDLALTPLAGDVDRPQFVVADGL
jgi:hypothetical protein